MVKKNPKTVKCKCIELFNKALAERNAELDTSDGVNFKTKRFERWMRIPLRKVNSKIRKPLPNVLVTYCPICGRKASW